MFRLEFFESVLACRLLESALLEILFLLFQCVLGHTYGALPMDSLQNGPGSAASNMIRKLQVSRIFIEHSAIRSAAPCEFFLTYRPDY